MTTPDIDDVQATGGNTTMLSSSRGVDFYIECAIVVIGIVGAAANALVLYAMIVSKQNTKQLLIYHQNVFDLCSCLLLVLTYTLKLCNIYLSGTLGYWLHVYDSTQRRPSVVFNFRRYDQPHERHC